MGETTIQWTDRTWNPVRGCSRVSEGCRNCYAERIAARFSGRGGAFQYFADKHQPRSKWTGKVEVIEEKLTEPLHWKKTCRCFVNSMSDLFHENLPDESIDRVFAVMYLTPHITYQVLTKRASRMQGYRSSPGISERIVRAAHRIAGTEFREPRNPLANVHLGVSVENQATAVERIPLLLETPAAIRFVSYEPALAGVNFDAIPISVSPGFFGSPLGWHHRGAWHKAEGIQFPTLDWIIIGGESGPGARPFKIQWARDVIAQCAAAQVPVFMKQLGRRPFDNQIGYMCEEDPGKGGNPADWPRDLNVRQFPEVAR